MSDEETVLPDDGSTVLPDDVSSVDMLEELGRARQEDLESKLSELDEKSYSSPDNVTRAGDVREETDETIYRLEQLYNSDEEGLFRQRIAFLHTSLQTLAPDFYIAYRMNRDAGHNNFENIITPSNPARNLADISRFTSSNFNYDVAGRGNEYNSFMRNIYKQVDEIQNEMILYYGNRMWIATRQGGPLRTLAAINIDQPRTTPLAPIDPLNMPLNMGRPPNWPRHNMPTIEEVNTDGALSLAGTQDAANEMADQLQSIGGVSNEVSRIVNGFLEEERKTSTEVNNTHLENRMITRRIVGHDIFREIASFEEPMFPDYDPATYYEGQRPVYSYVRGRHATRNDIFRRTQ